MFRITVFYGVSRRLFHKRLKYLISNFMLRYRQSVVRMPSQFRVLGEQA